MIEYKAFAVTEPFVKKQTSFFVNGCETLTELDDEIVVLSSEQ